MQRSGVFADPHVPHFTEGDSVGDYADGTSSSPNQTWVGPPPGYLDAKPPPLSYLSFVEPLSSTIHYSPLFSHHFGFGFGLGVIPRV
jgi:hypothetical protein